MATIDSVKLPDNSTYDVTDNYSGYQKQTLATPLNINGNTETTVEGALGALNTYSDKIKDNLTGRNLLDNPFFTVNQRGFTSGTVSALNLKACVDRWYITYGISGTQTVTLGSSGLAFDVAASDYISLYQTYEKMPLKTGSQFTVSVMLQDGTIYSRTMPWRDETYTWFVSNDVNFAISKELSRFAFEIKSDITIRAVKLEVGSVSTLANDVEPDYALELAKCQTSTADPSDTYANKGNLVNYADLTTIHATGSTNTTGAQIDAGTFFYLNGQFCKALTNIANNATFTLNTNFEIVTVGGELNDKVSLSTQTQSNTDLDDLPTGFWRIGGDLTNAPSSEMWGSCISFNVTGGFQIVTRYTGDMYIRYENNGWSAWKVIQQS